MGEQVVSRGSPNIYRQDGWWFLDEDAAVVERTPTSADEKSDRRLPPVAIGALVFLVALADRLFWDADPGVSIAIFALALSAFTLAFKPKRASRSEATFAMGFAVACNLPVLEQVQPLSVAFSATGIAVLLAWVALGRFSGAWRTLVVVGQASSLGLMILPLDIVSEATEASSGVRLGRVAKALALPSAIALVFGVLFTVANPLIGNMLSQISISWLIGEDLIGRIVFWALAACMLWPYLHTQRRGWANRTWAPSARTMASETDGPLLNTASVRTSLLVLNVMFGLQTVSDLGVLSGGMALPDGMTYAQYAHRGAYPLILTALLSGAFSLVTHRKIIDEPSLQWLMYFWLGQNMFLVLTAAFRLALYVDAYMLTYMRIAAFIWMGLVFVALALIVVRMAQGRSMAWLVRSNTIVVATTLYLCCFVNFAYVIATYNMASQAPGESLDLAYLCNLGEQAIPAMMEYGQITDQVACGRGGTPSIQFNPIDDWREWGFRRWRLQRYLEIHHDL